MFARIQLGQFIEREDSTLGHQEKPPLLKEIHVKNRRNFAKEHVSKPSSFWDKILWSDEIKIELFGRNCVSRVWRLKNSAFHPKNIVPTVKFGGGSIIVNHKGKVELRNVSGYS
jgi:hypothetical protein